MTKASSSPTPYAEGIDDSIAYLEGCTFSLCDAPVVESILALLRSFKAQGGFQKHQSAGVPTPMPVSRYFAKGAGMGFNGVDLVADKDGDLVHYEDYKALEDLFMEHHSATDAWPEHPTAYMLDGSRWTIMACFETHPRTIKAVREHVRRCGGSTDHWPDWTKSEDGHLTKAGIAEIIYADFQRAARMNALVDPQYQAPADSPAHTDHALRHWDRTCPACIAEGTPSTRSKV